VSRSQQRAAHALVLDAGDNAIASQGFEPIWDAGVQLALL
jgi:hypothetical protein